MKINKKYFIFIFILIFITFINISVFATELQSFDMDIYIDENGKALVINKWYYYDDSGTEHFIPIKKEGIKIDDFKVHKNGKLYKTIPYNTWVSDKPESWKTNKAGIIDKGDEIELCWGIGDYGNNVYEISYTIDGFVKELNDSLMINYRLLNNNLSEAPQSSRIRIKALDYNTKLNKDNTKIWGFGYDGNVLFDNGEFDIILTGEDLKKKNYIHLLAQINKDIFNIKSEHYINKDFDFYKEKAFKDSEYESSSLDEDLIDSIQGLIASLFFTGLIFFVEGANKANKNKKIKIDINKNNYLNEHTSKIPYRGNLEDIYLLFESLYDIDQESLINYYFLKWIKDGVLVKEISEDGLFIKKEANTLNIVKNLTTNNIWEQEMFNIILDVAGANRVLEPNEFNYWIKNNFHTLDNVLNSIRDHSYNFLIKNNYIHKNRFKYKLTEEGEEFSINIIKFYNYLLNFSLLSERDSYNVHIWDDLMLYAAMYDITDVVTEEFKKLTPKYFNESNIDLNHIFISRSYSNNIIRSYLSENQRITKEAMSGFGGSSSFGGGSGGFGGSSGGGTR